MSDPDPTTQVPPWPKFARPVLEVLSDGQVWRTRDLKPVAMDRLQLSDAQRAVTVNSGQGKADNRAGWALSFLTRAKTVEKIKNGESRITDFGRQMLRDHPVEITEADLKAIPAFQAYVPRARATTATVDTEHLPSYWFVGAFFAEADDTDGPVGDQTARFIAEKRWVNGNEKYLDLVKSMKTDERIAIKAAFTRKHELPFETKGNRVSVMALKATGTITHNPGNGHTVDVNWDPPEPVREWYFYTNQQTVWQVKPADWKSKALIEFAFNDAEQDHDEFRNSEFWAERFGDEAPEVIDEGEEETTEEETTATPVYGVSDIIDDGCFLAAETLRRYLDAIERKKSLILQGPPGTGKTWLAKRLGRALIGPSSAGHLQSVQFHPTLSYEDFVRGWRPSGTGTLALADGIFLDIIKKAESTPGSKHVLVIEEINRGNLAQIFGELLTLLEADKRDPAEALTLTYRKPGENPIHIPENLYIIGTMNLADRSLAIVDFALRRRFAFADLSPQFNERWREWVSNRNSVDAGFLEALADRIGVLNQRISDDRSLGEQYRIGHSFFTPPHDTAIDDPSRWIRNIVEQEVGPLLAEYWFDDPAKVAAETAALIGAS
ncbi:AAA family ATPase [Mycobacterium sp. NPDC050441]|uniref:AAA family ATPase n=1 Tax=Mycobacterium sp. NPDC050441 TaxID=3155403 RepID=UPI0033D134EA